MSALLVKAVLERYRAGGGERGETLSHCLGRRMELPKINENNIHGGVIWPPIGKSTHDNQPKTGSRNRGEHEGGMRQAVRMGDVQ